MGAGAREDCRELSLDKGSAIGGIDGRDAFRGFATAGAGLGFAGGSALDRMLENAMGSAGRLGV